MYAAKNNDVKVVSILLGSDKVNIEAEDRDGRSPLWHAVSSSSAETVKLLLSTARVDVNRRDWKGKTLLMQASRLGHHDVVRLLLHADSFNKPDKQIFPGLVGLPRITTRADIRAKDPVGQTALHFAVNHYRQAGASLPFDYDWEDHLRQGEFSVKMPKKQRRPGSAERERNLNEPHDLLAGRYFETVKLLLGAEGLDIDAKDNHSRTAWSYALEHDRVEICRAFFEKIPATAIPEQRTALGKAVQMRSWGVVKELLVLYEVDANNPGAFKSVLDLAIAYSMPPNLFQLLLERGGDCREIKAFGPSALSYAASHGRRGSR